MADDNPTVFGRKATEQIAKTVREVARREMNPRGHRGRWQFHGDGGITATAYATITESGENDEFQTVDLYRTAEPATFTTATCGDMDFDDMQFTLHDLIESDVVVLVPAGYKAGEALLIKMNVYQSEHEWSGWAVFTGPTLRCAFTTDHDPECCPIEGLKMTRFEDYWAFGAHIGTRNDPCEEA